MDEIFLHHVPPGIWLSLDGSLPDPDAVAESDKSMHRIMLEMVILGTVLLCNELARAWVARRGASRFDYALWISSLVLGWYTVSVTLVLYNKWLLTLWQDQGVHITITFTMCHMILKGVFATLYTCCRGTWPATHNRKALCVLTIAGMLAAFDIVASNLALLRISTAFYTFLKSASLIFLLVGAVIAGIEEFSTSVFLPIGLVVAGMLLATAGEPVFDMVGFSYVMASEVFAAARWVLTQVALQRSTDLDAMTCVLYMAPGSSLALMPFAIAREKAEVVSYFANTKWYSAIPLVLFPGLLAFALLLVEVQLVKDTSSLTLTVFGNLKSVVTILFAVAVFGDATSPMQWGGLLVAILGLIAYSHTRGEWQIDDIFGRKTCDGVSTADPQTEHQALLRR